LKLIIDTNVMFSFFWKNSITKKLLLNQNNLLFAPEFALEELKKYEKEIIHKAKITKKEFNEIRNELAILIDFVPLEEYKKFLRKGLIASPDNNDVDFFALAIKLKLPLWSNDNLLKNQKIIQVLNTKEILQKSIVEDDF
jgi:predicted nucleic acid-binding protein